MKINEVEQLVGVTKRNIRFYEKEGLLNPGRNADNGYRDYTDADVEALRKIKLLRKLDVPMEEIRKMQQGILTLDDGLRRHIIQLEREQANLATIRTLCQTLADAGQQLADLDADRWLSEMDRMEGEGTRFVNIHKKDTVSHYIPPVVCALLFVVLMGPPKAPFWTKPRSLTASKERRRSPCHSPPACGVSRPHSSPHFTRTAASTTRNTPNSPNLSPRPASGACSSAAPRENSST